jgi:hypothetical protein
MVAMIHIGANVFWSRDAKPHRMRCQTRMQMMAPIVAMMISPMML